MVIGSGIAAISLSSILAERGYGVTLVGIPDLSSKIAKSSSGILTYHMKEPFLSLSLRTYEYYKRFAPSAVETVSSVWMSKDKAFMMNILEKTSEAGLGWRVIDSAESLGISLLDGETMVLADAIRINVGLLMEELSRRLAELDVKVLRGWGRLSAAGVEVRGETVRGSIIVAAGPWSKELLNLEGASIYKCEAYRLTGPRVDVMIIDDTLDYYVNAAYDGTVAVGDGANIVVDVPEDAFEADIDLLDGVLHRARRRGILRDHSIAYAVSAPCIGTSDSYPLLGEVREDLYAFTGFNGIGFSVAPGFAQLMADFLSGTSRLPEEIDVNRKIPEGAPREPVD